MVEGSGAAIILYRIEPGTAFDLHSHEFSELGVVLAGEGEFRVGEDRRTLREGDSFYIPRGAPHGFSVPKGGTTAVLLNVSVALPSDAATLPATAELLRHVETVVRRSEAPRPVPG
jgi:quercetin dioxygenase-like cupin family protein